MLPLILDWNVRLWLKPGGKQKLHKQDKRHARSNVHINDGYLTRYRLDTKIWLDGRVPESRSNPWILRSSPDLEFHLLARVECLFSDFTIIIPINKRDDPPFQRCFSNRLPPEVHRNGEEKAATWDGGHFTICEAVSLFDPDVGVEGEEETKACCYMSEVTNIYIVKKGWQRAFESKLSNSDFSCDRSIWINTVSERYVRSLNNSERD